MEIRDVPLFIIIIMPVAIIFLELFIHGVACTWKWFIRNNNEEQE